MGVKGKAALAIIVLLLFLGSLWLRVSNTVRSGTNWDSSLICKHHDLPEGGLDYHWDSCLKSYNQLNQVHQLSNSSEVDLSGEPLVLEECPGQNFQVSLLLSHLLASSTSNDDVLLKPYLLSWDELVKFMEALGPMVGLISQEIQTKTTIIRQLALQEEQNSEAELQSDVVLKDSPDAGMNLLTKSETSIGTSAYHSVRSMIGAELERNLVDFAHHTDSGCRTLLRLHRALLWLKLFLDKLAETPTTGRLRSPSDLCRESYQVTLAKHHTWLVRKAAELAFIALPERGFFHRLVCVQNQEELGMVLKRVTQAIGEAYDRTQRALEEHGMLDLP